jgi:hypothetical protein
MGKSENASRFAFGGSFLGKNAVIAGAAEEQTRTVVQLPGWITMKAIKFWIHLFFGLSLIL